MHNDLRQAIYLIAGEMRGMATVGGHYAKNPYEVERARRIRELAVRLAALVDDDYDEPAIRSVFSNVGFIHASPAVGVEAAVFNERGELLLIQRQDNG
jgi:hypothetical protein